MTTRGTMITEILADMRRSSAADISRVEDAISAAIKRYQPKRFYFNESRDVTFNTVADQMVYSFAGASPDIDTPFYKIDEAILEDTVNDFRLARRFYEDIELIQDAGSTSNRPYSYGYINQSILLYPVPDAIYTIRLTGHVKLAEPATDSTANNQWFVEAYELIKSRAKIYLYGHVYSNPTQASIMVSADQDAFNILISATESKAGTGNIVPTDF